MIFDYSVKWLWNFPGRIFWWIGPKYWIFLVEHMLNILPGLHFDFFKIWPTKNFSKFFPQNFGGQILKIQNVNLALYLATIQLEKSNIWDQSIKKCVLKNSITILWNSRKSYFPPQMPLSPYPQHWI